MNQGSAGVEVNSAAVRGRGSWPGWRNPVVQGAVALAIYVLLSLLFCLPLPGHMATDVAGRYVDARVFQWNNWWVKHALLAGQSPNYTDYLYYPSGVSLASHNLNWISSLLSVPLDMLLGPIVTYNLLFLLTFWGSAFAMYLLARDLLSGRGAAGPRWGAAGPRWGEAGSRWGEAGSRWGAAFVAGLVFGFFPYHASGNLDGQMNLANIQWLPLFALFFLRTLQARRARDALLAGLFLALACLDCWFFAIFLAMWALVALPCVLLLDVRAREGLRPPWRLLGTLLLTVLAAGAVMAPFAIPVLRELGGTTASALSYYTDDKSTDLLAFLVPSSDHPLLDARVHPLYERFAHWRPAFLGYAALALAVWGMAARRRAALPWGLTGLAFALLALGTQLRIGGQVYPSVPMPYRLLTDLLPALKIVRQPSRFNVMVGLSLAALAGLGCHALLARLAALSPRRPLAWQGAAVALLSVLIAFEYLAWPCPLSTASVPPFYDALAEEGPPGSFAILELPIDDFHSRESLYPQTIHQQKLVNGYVARMPPGTLGFVYSQPLIRTAQIQMDLDPTLFDLEREVGLLAANDIRYVVLHKQALPPQPPVDTAVLASWRALFGPDPVYEDDQIAAYRTRSWAGYSSAPVLSLGEELGAIELRVRRAWTRREGEEVLAVEMTWQALRDVERDYACRLLLQAASGETVAAGEAAAISPRYPTSRWREGTAVGERYLLWPEVALPAGPYSLLVEVSDAGTGEVWATATQETALAAASEPLVPALEGMAVGVGARFGDKLELLGYTPRQEGDRLALDVYWLALRPMLKYKIFFHLLDPAVGRIAAQHDGMPRDWSYPTSLWGRGEVFVDRIELEVGGVPPGSYRLAVGVYEPEGERLAAVDAEGRPQPDGRAILDAPVEVKGR